VEGVRYLPWLLAGIAVWFFVNQAVLLGSKSIYTRIRMIAKMRFPMSVIPTYVILAKFYQHLMLVAVILGMLQFMGYPLSIYFVQLPYFMFATLVLLVACALVTSTLSTIVRDVQMIVHSFMRILLYLTPILYSVSDSSDRVPEFVKLIMKVNPLWKGIGRRF
jgi:teichoic acid transport system permease protein